MSSLILIVFFSNPYLVKASFLAEKQQVDAQEDKKDGCYGRQAAHKDRRGWMGGRLGRRLPQAVRGGRKAHRLSHQNWAAHSGQVVHGAWDAKREIFKQCSFS
jgi:hypothetical protein